MELFTAQQAAKIAQAFKDGEPERIKLWQEEMFKNILNQIKVKAESGEQRHYTQIPESEFGDAFWNRFIDLGFGMEISRGGVALTW